MESDAALTRVPPTIAIDGVVELLESLSTRDFCATLLRKVNNWADVDHCSLMRLMPAFGIQLYGAQSAIADARTARVTVRYLDHFHRRDANRRFLADARLVGRTVVMNRTTPADVDRAYREECYEEARINDRLSFLTRTREGLVALNFYRIGSPAFSERDIETLHATAPLFAVAGARHIELLLQTGSDPSTWRQRLKVTCPALTHRELDVAAHLLAGRTLRDAANALGVAHSTVVTYRERAYARLGVATLKELRARFAGSPRPA
jgi:DNA-binding CsgD family transcriptional regulator